MLQRRCRGGQQRLRGLRQRPQASWTESKGSEKEGTETKRTVTETKNSIMNREETVTERTKAKGSVIEGKDKGDSGRYREGDNHSDKRQRLRGDKDIGDSDRTENT